MLYTYDRELKTVDIHALKWFDKVNGNTYFSLQVILNYGMDSELILTHPYDYGYGAQYVTEAEKLIKASLFDLRQNSVIVREFCTYTKKAIVKRFGEGAINFSQALELSR